MPKQVLMAGLAAVTLCLAGISDTMGAQGALARPDARIGDLAIPFEVRGATLPSSQDSASQTYQRLCAACHGRDGKGDGPAAAALDPTPSDFTATEFQEARSDEQIATAIADGVGGMPGFSSRLSTAQIEALVQYVRHLGGDGTP